MPAVKVDPLLPPQPTSMTLQEQHPSDIRSEGIQSQTGHHQRTFKKLRRHRSVYNNGANSPKLGKLGACLKLIFGLSGLYHPFARGIPINACAGIVVLRLYVISPILDVRRVHLELFNQHRDVRNVNRVKESFLPKTGER